MIQPHFTFVYPEQEIPAQTYLQPASYLRKTFTLEGKPLRATLYTTALGVYEPYINGRRADEARLMPGFTNYHARVQYFESDVTEFVKEGKNVIAAVLGDGWYRGCLGAFSQRAFYGDRLMFAAALEIKTAQETIWIHTDENTKASQTGSLHSRRFVPSPTVAIHRV